MWVGFVLDHGVAETNVLQATIKSWSQIKQFIIKYGNICLGLYMWFRGRAYASTNNETLVLISRIVKTNKKCISGAPIIRQFSLL